MPFGYKDPYVFGKPRLGFYGSGKAFDPIDGEYDNTDYYEQLISNEYDQLISNYLVNGDGAKIAPHCMRILTI